MFTVVPRPTSELMLMWPSDCLTKPNTWLRPRPVPLPTALVVKNGSKTRSMISGGMPVPVSETAIRTYRPAATSPRSRASKSSSSTFDVSILSSPPFGIASRALIDRLRIAFSSWLMSVRAFHNPSAITVSRRTCSPSVRRISSDMDRPWRRHPRSVGSAGVAGRMPADAGPDRPRAGRRPVPPPSVP